MWNGSNLVLCCSQECVRTCHLNQQTCHYIVFQVCSCWLWELLKWAPSPAGYMPWLLWEKQTSRKIVHIVVKSRDCSWGKAGRSEGNCDPLTSQGSCWIWWLLLAPGPSIPSILRRWNSLSFWEGALMISTFFRCFLSPACEIWVWLLVSPQNCMFLSTFPESIHC